MTTPTPIIVDARGLLPHTDVAGVLARISKVFGEHGVSIASMIQKGRGAEAELVLITHPTREKDFFAAITEARDLPCCHSEPMILRVL